MSSNRHVRTETGGEENSGNRFEALEQEEPPGESTQTRAVGGGQLRRRRRRLEEGQRDRTLEDYMVEKGMATEEIMHLAMETRERYRERYLEDKEIRRKEYRRERKAIAKAKLMGMVTREEAEAEAVTTRDKRRARENLIRSMRRTLKMLRTNYMEYWKKHFELIRQAGIDTRLWYLLLGNRIS